MSAADVDECQDVAVQVFTALMHDDVELAAEVIVDFRDPRGLAMALATVLLSVHRSWAAVLDISDEHLLARFRDGLLMLEERRSEP